MDSFSHKAMAKMYLSISLRWSAGLSGLNEGQVVEYEEVSNKGKTSAENLRVQR
jgi:cold shock protein